MKRDTLKRIIRWLMKHLTTTELYGQENIPLTGGCILATNHLSRLDSAVLFTITARDDLTALVTTKYKAYPLIKWLANTAGGIWLERETADFGAFRLAIKALNEGLFVGIAPEGTRSKTGGLMQGKPGAALLAVKAGVPIVPVGIIGTEDGMKKLLTFRRTRFIARFGKPFILPPLDRNDREGQMGRNSDEVMCRIAVLLPEEYRGIYRDHPRVKELLAENQA